MEPLQLQSFFVTALALAPALKSFYFRQTFGISNSNFLDCKMVDKVNVEVQTVPCVR